LPTINAVGGPLQVLDGVLLFRDASERWGRGFVNTGFVRTTAVPV
jgi:hypothetical protein